jgi:hypothetical protein
MADAHAPETTTSPISLKLRLRDPILAADIADVAKTKKISKNSEMVQRLDRGHSLAAAMSDFNGTLGAALFHLEMGVLRVTVARAGSSIDRDWVADGVGDVVAGELGLLHLAVLSPAPTQEVALRFANLIEGALHAGRPIPPAAEVVDRVGNTDPNEFSAESTARTRKHLGTAGQRLIALRTAILAELEARRDGA